MKPRSTSPSIRQETMVPLDPWYMYKQEVKDDKHCEHHHDNFGIQLVSMQIVEGGPYTQVVVPRHSSIDSRGKDSDTPQP